MERLLSKGVKFLGMTIVAGTIAISTQSMQKARDRNQRLFVLFLSFEICSKFKPVIEEIS